MFLEKLIISDNKDLAIDFFAGHYSNEIGQLSFLLKTKKSDKKNKIRKELVDFAEDKYYSQKGLSIEKAFENFLREINNFWRNREYKNDTDLLFFVTKDNQIIFSKTGSISVLLYQNQKIIGLTQPTSTDEEVDFSDIVSGKLTNDDKLFFVTNNILESLKENINDKNILEKIKEMNTNSSIGLVVLSLKKAKSFVKNKSEILPKKVDKISVSDENLKDHISNQLKIKNYKPNIYKKFIKKLNNKILKFTSKFENFSYLQKILFTLYLILIIVFIYSLFALGHQEISKKRQKRYFTIVHQIEEKKNELKSSLIYNNKTKAKNLLCEINALFKTLTPRTEKERESYNLINNQLKKFAEKLYSQKFIENPEILINLEEMNPQIRATNIINIDGDIYTFDRNTNFIYQIKGRKIEKANETSVNVGYLEKMISFGKDNLIFVCNNHNLADFDLVRKKLSPISLASSFPNLQIKDIASYSESLYILDSKDSQILEYTKTIDGFAKEIKWLQEEANLNNAISIAIDGSIYILKRDGEVIKFYKGKKVKFSLEKIYPKLTDAIKIYTNADLKYIYILDPTNKRLVIFKKDGRLKEQLISSKFNDLKDFAISRNEKIIWFLNGNTILRVLL